MSAHTLSTGLLMNFWPFCCPQPLLKAHVPHICQIFPGNISTLPKILLSVIPSSSLMINKYLNGEYEWLEE